MVRTLLVSSVVAVLCTATGATAATLITGAQVKNGSLTGQDIRDRSIKRGDLARSARAVRGPQGIAGSKGDTGPQGPQGAPGPSALYTERLAAGATVDPGKIGHVIVTCPHGLAVTITPKILQRDAQTQVVPSVLPHDDRTIELNMLNNGPAPVSFWGTLTCIDTQPF